MHTKLSDEQKKFILKNYSILGRKGCAEKLQINLNSIWWFAKKNNIKFSSKSKSAIGTKNLLKYWNENPKTINSYKINTRLFVKNFTIESAYILGLLWSDGSLYKNIISIECIDDDMQFFKTIIDKTGKWNYYTRQRKKWKLQTQAQTSNRYLYNFLKNNDFLEKSIKSPDKIVSKFKNINLIKAFLIGMIDGDGCFYYNEKTLARQFCISGSFEQDWTFIESIFKKLNITYKVSRNITKTSKHSVIRTIGRENIKKLGDFLFVKETEGLGLPRKIKKYKQIIQLTKNRQMFDYKHYGQIIIDYLKKHNYGIKKDFDSIILPTLSNTFSIEQKKDKTSNLLQTMKVHGIIVNKGWKWMLA